MRLFTYLSLCIFFFNLQTTLASQEQDFLRKKNCFPESYDRFVDSILETGSIADLDLIESERKNLIYRISAQMFADMKSNYFCEIFVYRSGNYKVGGIVLRPHESEEVELPAVIYNRGGNGRYGALDYYDIFEILEPLANGRSVFASQYRGGMHLFDGPEDTVDEFGGGDIEDIVVLTDIVRKQSYVDPNNIHMVGFSRGGMSSFMSVRKISYIKSLTVIGTPTDVRQMVSVYPEMLSIFEQRIPNFNRKREYELERRSVLRWVDLLPKELPILIIHGENDLRVPIEQATNLSQELEEYGHHHKLVIYNDSHGILFFRNRMHSEIDQWISLHGGKP